MISVRQLIDKFNTIEKTIENQKDDVLNEEADKALENIQARHGVYPSDASWARLKPQTVRYKKRGDTPLLETGELRDSYEKVKKSATRILVGSRLDKASFMEYGVASKNIPARPVVEPEAAQADDYVKEAFEDFIKDIVR